MDIPPTEVYLHLLTDCNLQETKILCPNQELHCVREDVVSHSGASV